MESIKETFKVLINEFYRGILPRVIKRDLSLPDWCFQLRASNKRALPPGFAVSITGPRRAGKTFYLYQIMDQLLKTPGSLFARDRIFYVNFEDDRLLPLEPSDLILLLDAYYELHPDNRGREVFIFLDEVQRIEGWDLFVRKLLETPGVRVFLAGSSSMAHSPISAGTLPGRALSVELLPLSFREYLGFKDVEITDQSLENGDRFKIRHLLDEFLIYGGYPEVVLAELSAKLRVLRDYYNILVYKDLVDRFTIRNVGVLKGLLKYLITRVGSTVSVNAYYLGLLAKNKVSRETVMDYVSYLQQNDLISLVPVFSDSEKTRRVNPRKVYCLDNGIRNAVSFNLAQDEERLARNAVFRALKERGSEIFYWREKGAGDVDFVLIEVGSLSAISVAYGREIPSGFLKSILEFRQAACGQELRITIVTKDIECKQGDIILIPLWKWLLSAQREHRTTYAPSNQ